jgi:RNA-directed DNA polymerase
MKERKAPRKKPKQLDPASESWNKLPWRKLEQHTFRIQKRIFRASQRGNQRAVHKLQKLLMKSQAARLVAVRRVTQDNQGKKTAGVDGVKSVAPQQRFVMVEQIHPKQWTDHKTHPVRRVWIPKPGKAEKRPLGIPTMLNRSQQALVKLALEPEWEAKFEPNSYGFRPGRSCHDAIEAIFKNISTKDKYVLDADIRGAFDHISHEALLRKLKAYPAVTRIIKSWLKAGVIDKRVFEKTEQGTPQGGVVSPLLMNIALHGMETALTKAYRDKEGRPQMVRYADDLVVFHPTEEGVRKAQAIIEAWLASIGLELKPSKTCIAHTLKPYQGKAGFEFLGFTVRQYPVGKYHTAKNQRHQPLGFKTFITPSKEAKQRHMQAIRQRMEELRGATQARLIKELNPMIRGWSNYYCTVVAKATFRSCDNDLYYMTKAWAKRRHSNKNMHWIMNKYWGVNRGSGWSFETPKGLALAEHGKVKIQRHVKVRGSASPYDGNLLYWSKRLKSHPLLGGTLGKLLQKQQGKCRWCELLFRDGDLIEVDHITPRSQGGGEELSNKFALHRHCHDQRHTKQAEGRYP